MILQQLSEGHKNVFQHFSKISEDYHRFPKTTIDFQRLTKIGKDFRGISPGGGGVPKKVLYGEAPPRRPTPYPFIYHFFRKRHPFRIPFIGKRHPFHIPSSFSRNTRCNRHPAKRHREINEFHMSGRVINENSNFMTLKNEDKLVHLLIFHLKF